MHSDTSDFRSPSLDLIGRQFQTIMHDVPIGITIFRGPQFVVEMATKTYLEIVDRKEQDFVGRPLFDSLPEVKEVVEPLLTNVLTTGVPYYGNEFPITLNRYGKSELAYFNFVYQPTREANGDVSGIIVVANEVTATVIAKQLVTESESKFRNLVMTSPVAKTIFTGEDFVIDMANKQMIETLWRRKPEEVLGKKLLEVFPELNDQKYPALLRRVYHEGVIHSEKESVAYVQGDEGMKKFYLDYTYQPLRGSGDKVHGIIATVTDVTDKVETRKRIEEAEEKLRLAIASADLGTYEVDLATNKVTTSDRFNEIWGITQPMERMKLASFIHPDDHELREKAHAESLKTGNLEYEARLNKANGMLIWIRVKGKVLFDTTGKPLTLVGVVQDITEQKMFAVELERQVLERTEELQAANEEIAATNEELSEANNSLVNANFDLEQFNYAASHDLQEPVRKIQTFSDMLLTSSDLKLDERHDSYLKKIASAARRMKTIIDDLLLYSHHSRAEKELIPTDLNDVVKTVQSDLDLMIDQKQATIVVDNLPTIDAVPVQMHQLFLNLISNALKFSREGVAPSIAVRYSVPTPELRKLRQLSSDKRYHHITVQDNGIGFQQDYADYIFQLFKRLHRKNEYSGTGIGLSLCKKIVENHRGTIFAESEPGKGTTMHILLPA